LHNLKILRAVPLEVTDHVVDIPPAGAEVACTELVHRLPANRKISGRAALCGWCGGLPLCTWREGRVERVTPIVARKTMSLSTVPRGAEFPAVNPRE
jgi:hypothetical protein